MLGENKGKISYSIYAINIIPLILLGITMLFVGNYWITQIVHSQVKEELYNTANQFIIMYDALYPGDYDLVGDSALQLYKGDQNITNGHSLFDNIKDTTGIDITLFYQDTRILTTIQDSAGNRLVGTAAHEDILKCIYTDKQPYFSTNLYIYGTGYFSYYTPIYNSDGSITGMLFVGKPNRDVNASIQKMLFPIIVIDIILLVVVSFFTFIYTRNFTAALLHIHDFLKEVSEGNLNFKLSPKVLRRNDELSEIGFSALNMQRSLSLLIERDALTNLFNRRAGDRKLHKIMDTCSKSNQPFCIALCDIDFFKKVNDTYGHDAGDVVLKEVATLLRENVRGVGIVSRWGGEEFLIIFENMDLTRAHGYLKHIVNQVRSREILYNGQIIKVTVTIGLIDGYTKDTNELLRAVDAKLYYGKQNGRDRIVCDL